MAQFVDEKYWIDPKGNVLEVHTDRHIHEIMTRPGLFGLSEARVRAVFKKYGERWGTENKAREELMSLLIEKGWIRLRRIPNEYLWVAQLDDRTPYRTKLETWAKWIVKREPKSRMYGLRIINLVPEVVEARYTVSEVARGVLAERRKHGQFAEFLNPAGRRYRRYDLVKRTRIS